MSRVAGFGELMLRLAPEGFLRFQQADKYEAVFGGAEANVCVSLAQMGVDARFISALPEHALGQAAVNSLRALGVDTDYILRQGPRVGIYFCEKGAAQRPSKVIYDRAGSSISKLQPGEIDWDKALEGVDWFHFTGITPALGDNVARCCLEAMQAVKKKGIRSSCDINYRSNLWSKEKAGKVMTELVEGLDICIGNEAQFDDVFGIVAPAGYYKNGVLSDEGNAWVAEEMRKRFGIKEVDVTFRQSRSASDNDVFAMIYDGDLHFSKRYTISHIVDRVGGGDSFGAGLIYAKLNNFSVQDTVEFATAADVLKHSVEGDYNIVTTEEVMRLMNGDGMGRILR